MKRTNIPEERINNIRAELHRVEKVYKDGLSFDLSVGKKFTLLMNGTVIRRYQDPSQIVQDAILLSIGYHTALTRERLENRNSRDRLAKQLHDGQTEIKEMGVKETPSITEEEKEEVMQTEEDMDITETLESETMAKEEEILSLPECRVHAAREETRQNNGVNFDYGLPIGKLDPVLKVLYLQGFGQHSNDDFLE